MRCLFADHAIEFPRMIQMWLAVGYYSIYSELIYDFDTRAFENHFRNQELVKKVSKTLLKTDRPLFKKRKKDHFQPELQLK